MPNKQGGTVTRPGALPGKGNKDEMVCWGCGETGHRRSECPNADSSMAPVKGDGKVRGRKAIKGDKGQGKTPWMPTAAWWRSI